MSNLVKSKFPSLIPRRDFLPTLLAPADQPCLDQLLFALLFWFRSLKMFQRTSEQYVGGSFIENFDIVCGKQEKVTLWSEFEGQLKVIVDFD